MNLKQMKTMLEGIAPAVKVRSISITPLGYVIDYAIHEEEHKETVQTNIELMILEGEIAGYIEQLRNDAQSMAQKEVDAGTVTIQEPEA
jgi:hypothetical protein